MNYRATSIGAEIDAVEGAHPPSGLLAARAALWMKGRDLWAPRTLQTQQGAALTAGRPHTAYRKIVDVAAESTEAFRALVQAAIQDTPPNPDGTRPAPIVIKFEEHPALAPLTPAHRDALLDLGFIEDPAPFPSVPSTRPEDETYTRSWSKWLGERPTREVVYYGQSTDVTCGPTTALMALEQAGFAKLGNDSAENHAIELEMWRRATNYPGCDPVSMALAVAEDIADSGLGLAQPTVLLSAPGLVLIDDEPTNDSEIRLREALQRDALRRAEQIGLNVERRWFTVEEIRDIVKAGSDVFLMITLQPLINDLNPHWVLVHDVVADTLIVSDPWVEAESGESWVDCHSLPIPLAGIDLIARWGDPVYRAIIVLSR